MLGTYRRLIVVAMLPAAAAACNKLQTTTDLHTSRMDDSRQAYGAHLTYMVDNAMLHDMSVADIHFIPHTGEISGVGEVRLNRLARLLNTYGGTLRYETLLDDGALVKQRLEHTREYLALTGCDMERVQVVVMMSGGRGMPGDEAVEKFEKGTEQETDSGSSPLTFVPSSSGNQ